MVIANPIFDVVFKRLMENEKVAKFFISTLLELNIESVEVKPQEFTYEGDINDPKVLSNIKERLFIQIFRLDFIATIKTETGELKKVLIEIQKARNPIDLMRFRNYLGEQYKKEDTVNNEKVVLPITTIYILGFNLSEIKTACIKVERNYFDLIGKKIIDEKSPFIEKLTHDCFVVQVLRINNRFQTKLDMLLSIFEQNNFIDDKEITKEFLHETDSEEIKVITDILHYSGTDPKEKRKIETEQEAWRTITAMMGNTGEAYLKAMKDIERKDKEIENKDKEIENKDKEIEAMKQQMEDLMKKLNNKQ